jgi:hypothetical protein
MAVGVLDNEDDSQIRNNEVTGSVSEVAARSIRKKWSRAKS